MAIALTHGDEKVDADDEIDNEMDVEEICVDHDEQLLAGHDADEAAEQWVYGRDVKDRGTAHPSVDTTNKRLSTMPVNTNATRSLVESS